MSTGFDQPGTSTGLNFEELKGHLLLFTVDTLEHGIKTTFGDKDAIRCDVVDLETGNTYHDTLVFPLALIGQLKESVGGKRVLGRLGQGNAKPGQKPPWKLGEFTQADADKATAHINGETAATIGGTPAVEDDAPPF